MAYKLPHKKEERRQIKKWTRKMLRQQRREPTRSFQISEKDMLKAGERAFNIEKAYNTRCGATRADDTIPDRFFEEPLRGGGPSGGSVVERDKFDRILEEYYEDRKFDPKTGLPTRAGLESLGLKDIAEDLEARGKLGG